MVAFLMACVFAPFAFLPPPLLFFRISPPPPPPRPSSSLNSFTDSDDGTTFDGCGVRDSTAYYYPDEDTTQYLYETFPEVRRPTIDCIATI